MKNAAVSVLLALGIAACGRGREARQTSKGSDAHASAGAGGSNTSDGAAGSGGGSSPGSPEACRWPGWNRTARLPPGCTGLCVPDDVKIRVPTLKWADRTDWCSGCRSLLTPWATTDAGRSDAASGVIAIGSAPDAFLAGISEPDGGLAAVFDSQGVPLAAWKTDYKQQCGRFFGLKFSNSEVGIHLLQDVGDSQLFARVPVERAAELMTSTTNTFVWPAAFAGHRGINEMWFNDEQVAADFSGSIGLGDIATGKTVQINQALTGQPGTYNQAQLVGRTAFASRSDGIRTDWWVYEGEKLRQFLGDANTDISFMVTDGTTMIWKQGSNPLDQPDKLPSRIFRRYDLYRSPYATDVASLNPTLLLPNLPDGYSWPVLQNGYLVGVYNAVFIPLRTGAVVVRLSDGRAWRSLLPGNYSWNVPLFPAGDELWGAVTPGPALLKSETIVRFPYAAMEVMQDHAP